MARMIPERPPDFHASDGERRVFAALRTLQDDVIVIHSFRWIHPGTPTNSKAYLRPQGEGDFVLFDPSLGVLVVEVKGGRVWCDTGQWFQQNRLTGQVNPIFPEAQASETMHRLRTEAAARIPEAKQVLFAHAVWFPDGTIDKAKLPLNLNKAITFDADDIGHPAAAIGRAFDFWRRVNSKTKGVSTRTAHQLLEVLAPTVSVVRSMRQGLDEREEKFVQLTREQARIVEFLDEQQHAAITGVAGTGKTLLAVEKARRIASPTSQVLFLCFNAALRQHLHEHHAQPNVEYLTFHALARQSTGLDMERAVPAFLRQLADDVAQPYDHLIVDEAHDFDIEWLEWLKLRFRNGAFYAFYDRYQAIQGQMDTAWLDDIPCRLVLTRNCRNTEAVARVAYRACGLSHFPTFGVKGPQPVLHTPPSREATISKVSALVASACKDHKLPPHEIAVLTLETIGSQSAWQMTRLGGFPVTDVPKRNHISLTTVRRFKGLEATLVIIVDADFEHASDGTWRRRLYVACSRARHAVHIFSETPEDRLGGAVKAMVESSKARPSWRSLSRALGVRLAGTGDDDPFHE